jgi:type III restriction enzyme
MRLKDYQVDALEKFSAYLRELSQQRRDAEEYAKFQREKGRDARSADYCRDTWVRLHDERALPRPNDGSIPPYVPRFDGIGRPIPNVCLKLPTGGGKTLLGCEAVGRVNSEYFGKQTGLVLWVVPSDAIYSQTWKAFANREHPYRQTLERVSGGRVKLLEKNDTFTKQDVEHQFCVMLLMLQASARRTKEQLKMFQDSGRYMSFFPEVDDLRGNEALWRQIGNLDRSELTDEEYRAGGLTLKQSLGNVLRMERPIIVIDEGHKAYSEIALQTLCGFNPRFILEMSATPNSGGEHVSNVVVNVTGTALKDEEMIKLPVNLINSGRTDWKYSLAEAKEKLDELVKEARKVQNNEGRYVRPILLIRVERTGHDQIDKVEAHSETVRKHLIEKLGAHPEEIKVKSAELDELGDEDLLSEYSKVRYIITKDALREGWDCPFAYILAILSKTTAITSLTQMVGRVLRQPHAKWTKRPALNECYVFTHDQDVQAAVESVRRGLSEEGMGDLAADVRMSGKGLAAGAQRITINRRKEFERLKIFMPRVLSRHPRSGEWRLFDYDRDLLSRIAWDTISYTNRETFRPDQIEAVQRTLVRVSVEDLGNVDDDELKDILTTEQETPDELDEPALVRLLLDVIPNPWQGMRILRETLQTLRNQEHITEERLYTNRLALIKEMREDLRKQVHEAGERIFRNMLTGGELCFRLEASGDPVLNWELAKTFELDVTNEDLVLVRQNGQPVQRSLFEKVYQKQVNGLERDVALYLDEEKAVRWWHRIAVYQDWHLQGWQRSRVYPDFLICLHEQGDGIIRFSVLETKGLHLKGSEDTEYKRKLFELLTEYSRTALPVGELKLEMAQQQIRFALLMSDDWRARVNQSLQPS